MGKATLKRLQPPQTDKFLYHAMGLLQAKGYHVSGLRLTCTTNGGARVSFRITPPPPGREFVREWSYYKSRTPTLGFMAMLLYINELPWVQRE